MDVHLILIGLVVGVLIGVSGVGGSALLTSFLQLFPGSKLCAKLSDSWLRPAVAGILLLAGSRLL